MVTADAAVRARTLGFLRQLIEFAADCGASTLVHGSPKQRSPQAGQSVADATGQLESALAELAPHAKAAGVTYCIEPLSRAETPVINTVAEAAALVDRIGSSALRTMLDVSAASQAETEPVHEVLARYLASGHIAHVQLNDRNRRGPGQGDTDAGPCAARVARRRLQRLDGRGALRLPARRARLRRIQRRLAARALEPLAMTACPNLRVRSRWRCLSAPSRCACPSALARPPSRAARRRLCAWAWMWADAGFTAPAPS